MAPHVPQSHNPVFMRVCGNLSVPQSSHAVPQLYFGNVRIFLRGVLFAPCPYAHNYTLSE